MAWFRRGKRKDDQSTPDVEQEAPASATAGTDEPTVGAAEAQTAPAQPDTSSGEAEQGAPVGPFDSGEAPDSIKYLRLGALWLPAVEGLMLTFEMDKAKSTVTAVQVVLGDSSMQLQAFAAPKSAGIWEEIRGEIRENLEGKGAEVADEETQLGTELVVTQGGGTFRFLGHDGRRWFLRGVMTGRAAVDAEAGRGLRNFFAHVVVDRGDEPMGPRELLPLHLPDQGKAQQEEAEGEESRTASDLDPFTRGPEITEVR